MARYGKVVSSVVCKKTHTIRHLFSIPPPAKGHEKHYLVSEKQRMFALIPRSGKGCRGKIEKDCQLLGARTVFRIMDTLRQSLMRVKQTRSDMKKKISL